MTFIPPRLRLYHIHSRGIIIYYLTNLTKRIAGCLADPENPEMGMGDPENPKNPENRLLNYPRTLKMQSVLPY